MLPHVAPWHIQREIPGPGQESVWDYPRPPLLQSTAARVTIMLGGQVVADTTRAFRVLETSHPPTYYVPPEDIVAAALAPTAHGSYCEWKGQAVYWSVRAADRVERDAAWSYPTPSRGFEAMAEHVAFYCALMDRCTVAGELAVPQPGGFYGGWVTSAVAGPFKGIPGSWSW